MAKRKRRIFTPEFKAEVVLEALSGESSQAEVCRRHNLSEDQLSKWKQQLVNMGIGVSRRCCWVSARRPIDEIPELVGFGQRGFQSNHEIA